MKHETRRLKSDLKVEKREDGRAGVISGYAIVYNSDSEDIGFIERVLPGACKKALKKSDVRALIDHDSSLIVGRTGKNLTLTEDKNGVFMELERPRVRSERFEQLAADIENGFIDSQSFAFTVDGDGAKWNDDWTKREVVEIEELFDVSLVTYPAYSKTTATFRAQDTTAAMEERTAAMAAAAGNDDEPIEPAEPQDKTDADAPTGPTIDARDADAISADSPTTEPPTEEDLDQRFLNALKRREGY